MKKGDKYHIDCEVIEWGRVASNVTVLETPRKTWKKVLVHIDSIRADKYINITEVK